MPVIELDENHRYFLIEFEGEGVEVADNDLIVKGKKYNGTSAAIQAAVLDDVTDVFFVSHGWLNTDHGAESSYRKWFTVMNEQYKAKNLQEVMGKLLVVGIHWPAGLISIRDFEHATKVYSAAEQPMMDEEDSYQVFSHVGDMISAGWKQVRHYVIDPVYDYMLFKLFGKYETTAIQYGKGPVFNLIKTLQQTTEGAGLNVRFHASGHSLGAHIISAAVCGPSDGDLVFNKKQEEEDLPQQMHSVSLLQAAVPSSAMARDGIYSRLPSRVLGPIVATKCDYDKALQIYIETNRDIPYKDKGKVDEVKLEPMMKRDRASWNYFVDGTAIGYDGMGDFNLMIDMLDTHELYSEETLRNGQITTVSSNKYISGHTDIAHAQVAHLVWSAAEQSTRIPIPVPATTSGCN